MKVKVDTSNPELLKKPEYKPLEAGKYAFEVANDLQVTMSKANKPMIHVELMCISETPEGAKGTVVFDTISLTKEARARYDRLACLCKACGVEPDASGEVDLEAFKGKQLYAMVTQGSYQVDPTTNKVPAPGYSGPTATKFNNKIDEYLFANS
jgi:hypothetical protein